MRLGGAKPDAIKSAAAWNCPACARAAPPQRPNKATTAAAPDFNEQLHLDLLEVPDSAGQKFTVLSVLDAASRYHMAVAIADKRPASVAHAFECSIY